MNRANTNKKAYSLTQIVFALAIIAVLMAMELAGISILQRSSRDSNRKNTLAALATILTEYNRNTLGYPDTNDLEFAEQLVLVDSQTVLELPGALQAGEETSATRTNYYYERTLQGYALCAELESGPVASVGSSECPDISMW